MKDNTTSKKALYSALNNIVKEFDDINFNNDDMDELQEWINCKEDFFHFLKYHIQLDLPGNENEFKYHIGQEITVRTLMVDHFAVVLKSRQIGITTVIRAYVVWLTIFHSNYSVGIISKSGPDASAFIRKCITLIDALPKFLRPKCPIKNAQQYILENGSMAMSAAVSASQPENTLRSNPIVFLIIDEGAFIHKIDEALSGLLPTTVTVQRAAERAGIPYGVLVISTPNKTKGPGKWFFDMYKQALYNNALPPESGKGTYKAIKLHWKDLGFPFDQEWYDAQCKVQNFNPENIGQEVDCIFLPSTKNGLISRSQVIEIDKYSRQPDTIINVEGGDIYIYDDTIGKTKDELIEEFGEEETAIKLEALSKRRFIVSSDTATAVGMDAFSATIGIDFDTNEQVLEYVGKLSTLYYPGVIRKCCDVLGHHVFLVVECNTIGEPVVADLYKDPEYQNKMFVTIQKNKEGKITNKFPGIQTNARTKPLLIEAVTEFFKHNIDKIHGERTILQITTVDVDKSKLIGKPNDIIMAYAFMAFVKQHNLVHFDNLLVDDTKYFNSGLDDMRESDILDYLYDKNPKIQQRIDGKRGKYQNPLEWLNN